MVNPIICSQLIPPEPIISLETSSSPFRIVILVAVWNKWRKPYAKLRVHHTANQHPFPHLTLLNTNNLPIIPLMYGHIKRRPPPPQPLHLNVPMYIEGLHKMINIPYHFGVLEYAICACDAKISNFGWMFTCQVSIKVYQLPHLVTIKMVSLSHLPSFPHSHFFLKVVQPIIIGIGNSRDFGWQLSSPLPTHKQRHAWCDCTLR